MTAAMLAAIQQAAVQQGRRDRKRQGLPARISDPVAIGKVAALVAEGGDPQ